MLFENLTEVVDPEPHGAALNMALDEILLKSAQGPVLRIYRWERPAVSFGYFGKYTEIEATWPEREPVRRWTGGGVVLHGDDLTYTLIVPRTEPFFRRPSVESYALVHTQIAALLERTGRHAELAAGAADKISNACFENAVQHDLVAEGRKIAGAAQRRTKEGLLHQGSIQEVGAYEALAERFGTALSGKVDRRPMTEKELVAATELAAEKYGSDVWLRRF